MMKTSVRHKLEPQRPEPQEQKSPPVPPESLEDIAWELWLLIELLAPVRRRLPNTASQKLVDYVKDRLIAKRCCLSQVEKGPPGIVPRLRSAPRRRFPSAVAALPRPPL